MKIPMILGTAMLVLAIASVFGLLPRERADATSDAVLKRGAYLVGPAGQCRDCHGQGLHGGHQIPAPNLAGLKMFPRDADAIRFLETALTPAGTHAAPPMAHYNFDASDATAIVAFLRQLR
jgi:mono/diheme cytochrome c family protein